MFMVSGAFPVPGTWRTVIGCPHFGSQRETFGNDTIPNGYIGSNRCF